MVKVIEHFESIQGEGPFIGTVSYFIRLSGCILRCPFCDSKFAWENNAGEQFDTIDINISDKCNHIIITGGEPLIHLHDAYFISFLKKYLKNKQISFETVAITSFSKYFLLGVSHVINKTIYNLKLETCDHHPIFIISPKLGIESYPISMTEEDIFRYYMISDTFKYLFNKYLYYKIIFEKTKYMIIKNFLKQLPVWFHDNIFIMPMTPIPFDHNAYIENCRDTIEFCRSTGIRYSPRIHIDVYGIRQGV